MIHTITNTYRIVGVVHRENLDLANLKIPLVKEVRCVSNIENDTSNGGGKIDTNVFLFRIDNWHHQFQNKKWFSWLNWNFLQQFRSRWQWNWLISHDFHFSNVPTPLNTKSIMVILTKWCVFEKKSNKSTDEEEDLSPIFQGNTKQLPNKNSIHFPISAGTSLSLLLKFSSFRKFLFLLIFPVRKIFLVTSWKIWKKNSSQEALGATHPNIICNQVTPWREERKVHCSTAFVHSRNITVIKHSKKWLKNSKITLFSNF